MSASLAELARLRALEENLGWLSEVVENQRKRIDALEIDLASRRRPGRPRKNDQVQRKEAEQWQI